MKIKDHNEISANKINMENTKNVNMRLLISKNDNAPEFSMRLFELDSYGHTPYHTHNWEHEVFILSGKGKLVYGENKEEHEFSDGFVVFVEPGAKHQFKNTEKDPLKFLCLVPNRGQN